MVALATQEGRNEGANYQVDGETEWCSFCKMAVHLVTKLGKNHSGQFCKSLETANPYCSKERDDVSGALCAAEASMIFTTQL